MGIKKVNYNTLSQNNWSAVNITDWWDERVEENVSFERLHVSDIGLFHSRPFDS